MQKYTANKLCMLPIYRAYYFFPVVVFRVSAGVFYPVVYRSRFVSWRRFEVVPVLGLVSLYVVVCVSLSLLVLAVNYLVAMGLLFLVLFLSLKFAKVCW